jgi:Holliday junction resolvasome RuvABC endonuclease subunit
MFNIIVGVDYSITSPCLCLFDTRQKFCFENCQFYFLTDTLKYANKFLGNITGELFDDYAHDTERFDTISEWAVNLCIGAAEVSLEGYAYNSTGRIFNLAENVGILKHKLYKQAVPVSIIEPSKVKKKATGKGNADKQMMFDAFESETHVNLKTILAQKTLSNPVTDIIDSFYIAKILAESKIIQES